MITNCCRIIVRVYLKTLGRPGSRWEDNVGVDLREIIWQGVDCMVLAQDTDRRRTVVNPLMNVPFR